VLQLEERREGTALVSFLLTSVSSSDYQPENERKKSWNKIKIKAECGFSKIKSISST
jgi:hypothetical protein